MRRIPPLYPIVDGHEGRGRSLFDLARAVIDGGGRLLQVREKEMTSVELFRAVVRILDYASCHGAVVIVNDRVDIAKAAGADGVHLGQDDLPPAAAREILGDGKIIGLSTHSMEEFDGALPLPVDYIAVGPIFPTKTAGKTRSALGVGFLKRIGMGPIPGKPVVAIGGINGENARIALEAGADSVALISALMREEDVEAATRRLLLVCG